MKLWDSLTTCLLLLSSVRAGPPTRSQLRSASSRRRGPAAEGPVEPPPLQEDTRDREESPVRGQQYTMEALPLSKSEDVVDFIKVTIGRLQRPASSTASPSTSSSTASPTSKEKLRGRTRQRRERKKQVMQQSGRGGRGGAGGGRTGTKVQGGGGRGGGQGCVLKQIHLNVSDLGLGYHSGEEMIFKYCSGPCRRSEANYDKILHSLAHSERLPPKDRPARACCRPTAFDDDLSFLDDNLVYHTVRKHSARRCGCV